MLRGEKAGQWRGVNNRASSKPARPPASSQPDVIQFIQRPNSARSSFSSASAAARSAVPAGGSSGVSGKAFSSAAAIDALSVSSRPSSSIAGSMPAPRRRRGGGISQPGAASHPLRCSRTGGDFVGEGGWLVAVAAHVDLLDAVRDPLLLQLQPDLLAVRAPRRVCGRGRRGGRASSGCATAAQARARARGGRGSSVYDTDTPPGVQRDGVRTVAVEEDARLAGGAEEAEHAATGGRQCVGVRLDGWRCHGAGAAWGARASARWWGRSRGRARGG